jgi:hypothetical protein
MKGCKFKEADDSKKDKLIIETKTEELLDEID